MRSRAVVTIALLLLPAASRAQRLPRPSAGREPREPAPLPGKQPEPIARELAYRRSRLSVESYPLVSYVSAPGINGQGASGATSWTTFGGGTRAEYRVTPYVSATMDLTSSVVGSPLQLYSAEVGTRLRRERTDERLYPYVDFRVGYVAVYNTGFGSVAPPAQSYGARYSTGFGAAAGVGLEYTLTRNWTLTTGATVLRSELRSHDFLDRSSASPSFGLTSYRYTLGVKYTAVRLVMPMGGDRP